MGNCVPTNSEEQYELTATTSNACGWQAMSGRDRKTFIVDQFEAFCLNFEKFAKQLAAEGPYDEPVWTEPLNRAVAALTSGTAEIISCIATK